MLESKRTGPTSELEWMLQNSQVSDGLLAGALARQYYSATVHLASWLVKDQEIAGQIARQAIQKVVSQRHRYSGEHSLRAWLYHVAFRLAKRRDPRMESKQTNEPVELLETGEWKGEELLAARRIFAALQPRSQLALVLRYVHALDADEIGYILGHRLKTIHSIFSTFRKAAGDEGQAPGGAGKQDVDQLQNDYDWIVDGPDFLHEEARARAELDLDGLLVGKPGEKEALRDHLCECSVCRVFLESLTVRERKIERMFQASIVIQSLLADELDRLEASLSSQTDRSETAWRVSRFLQQGILSLAVVAVIGWAAWMGNQQGFFDRHLESTAQPTRTPGRTGLRSEQRVYSAPPTPTAPQPVPTPANRVVYRLDDYGDRVVYEEPIQLDFSVYSDTALVDRSYFGWNHSGPLNLAALLGFWEWPVDRAETIEVLQPNVRDENVMPYELLSYIEESTKLRAMHRVGGDVRLLVRLLKAGYPILVERSVEQENGWAGIYDIIVGYNKQSHQLTLLSYRTGEAQTKKLSSRNFEKGWQPFNYTYLLVYPASREEEVKKLLGDHADPQENYRLAAERASKEIYAADNLQKFYAWFNRGTSLTYLDDYGGAAAAYDEAYAIYEQMPESERPWRMLWYQTRPYWAYYYTGRYDDLLDLANVTLENTEDPMLEESFYWRALAKEALGDIDGAIRDLKESVRLNPNFVAGHFQLRRLAGGT